jgi:phospholipid/cholesterol/gamma-HCH transport system permease protein
MSLSTAAKLLPGADLIGWLAPLGRASRYFALTAFSLPSLQFSWADLRPICQWMGPQSFHLVALAAVFIGIALTMQCTVELERYQAQDLAGAVISLGLLREMGPLTVSLAWGARVSALVADQAQAFTLQNPQASDRQFAASFIAPRYLSALVMSLPLGGYGLLVGFVTAALVTPLLTMSTTQQFLESAREMIQTKDLAVYFIKLILVNPTIAIFAGCAAGRLVTYTGPNNTTNIASPAARAVTALFICGFAANLIVSLVAYLK